MNYTQFTSDNIRPRKKLVKKTRRGITSDKNLKSFLEQTDTIGQRSSRYIHMEDTTWVMSDETHHHGKRQKLDQIARNLKYSNKASIRGLSHQSSNQIRRETSLRKFQDMTSASEKNLRAGLNSHLKEQQYL